MSPKFAIRQEVLSYCMSSGPRAINQHLLCTLLHPLMSVQRRIWFHHQWSSFSEIKITYNCHSNTKQLIFKNIIIMSRICGSISDLNECRPFPQPSKTSIAPEKEHLPYTTPSSQQLPL